MRVLIIGGAGTIGRKVANHLSPDHEVIVAGRKSGVPNIDISSTDSIQCFFRDLGKVDAIINIAGEAKWAKFDDLSEEDYYIGIKSKMMGQVNLVRIGHNYLSDGGTITLSTGILADHPVPMTAGAAMVNGAIHSFAKAASMELAPRVCLNVVSLGLVEDSADRYGTYFPGHIPVPMEEVVGIYEKALQTKETGHIFRVYNR